MLSIRAYREADESAVIALWDVVFPGEPPWNGASSSIRRKLSLQRDFFVLAEIDGHVVGTAMAGDDGYRGWVYYVAVDPQPICRIENSVWKFFRSVVRTSKNTVYVRASQLMAQSGRTLLE